MSSLAVQLKVTGKLASEVTTHLRGGGRKLHRSGCENYCRLHHDADVPTLYKPSCTGTLAMLHDSLVKLFSKIKRRINI